MYVSLEKDFGADGDDVFKGPVDPAVRSTMECWECPEDVTSSLELSWPLLRVVLTHTPLDLISDC